MTNHNAADIRGILNLLESINTPTILAEAPFTGMRAAFGDVKAKGELQRRDLKNRMATEWQAWLGQTGRTGDIEDMVQFLHVRVGFEPDDIRDIMGHEDVGEVPNPNIDEPAASEPQSSEPSEINEPEVSEPEADSNPTLSQLTPAQRNELNTKGRVELPDGRTIWLGDPNDDPPPTLRKIKDDDIVGAANDLMQMSDDDFDLLVQSSIDGDISEEEWAPVEAELQRRQNLLNQAGKKDASEDLRDLVQRLQDQLHVTESVLSERALSKKQADMIFDDAAKYVFAHGILDREAGRTTGGSRGRGGSSDISANPGLSQKSQSQIHAFLRQHDIADEIIFSLRETARRARGLSSFKGSQDHKILALIGLAYLKYRD